MNRTAWLTVLTIRLYLHEEKKRDAEIKKLYIWHPVASSICIYGAYGQIHKWMDGQNKT